MVRLLVMLVIWLSASAVGHAGDATALGGAYTAASGHPGVFMTRADLADLVERINVTGGYSARRFVQLTAQIARDVGADTRWDAAYSGCDTDTYNYAFSYEPQTIHGADHAARVRADMGLPASAIPPGGAAVVASRLALYAALMKAGARAPAGAVDPARAAALAGRILLAWSARGFRDEHGSFRDQPTQFCGGNGKFDQGAFAGVGLAVSRGILYFVQAEDMLLSAGALDEARRKEIDAFDDAMFALLRNALNYNFRLHAWPCDHYSNHAANQLAGLLALARIRNNEQEFKAVLAGGDPSIEIVLPWVPFLRHAIYGEGDAPNDCYANTGPDGLSSRPFFQTRAATPGEIDDRYRNADPGQGIGYPMFTLERLYDAAEILRAAGFDAYGDRRSIEMATRYYACLATGAGFGGTVTRANSGSCPDAAQYFGKIVSGVDRMVLIGAFRFPNDAAITGLESAAKTTSASGPFALDAILFGKWRD
jgi:hypothetical protein